MDPVTGIYARAKKALTELLNAEAHQNAEPSIEQGMKVLKCKCGHSMSDHHETGAGVCETCDCPSFAFPVEDFFLVRGKGGKKKVR